MGHSESELTSETLQRNFAAHLRNPALNAAPADIEDRRVQIYRDLIYNNIEAFISNGFPVIRTLYSDENWHALVRDFIHRHHAKSPYFLALGEEFINYLETLRADLSSDDPPFILELARYERAELALFVDPQAIPRSKAVEPSDILNAIPQTSPLAWPMVFSYPVHKIGLEFQPAKPEELPVCLVVYRNRQDQVKFLEANPVTTRLLALCENNNHRTAAELFSQIATELGHEDAQPIIGFGAEVLWQLQNLDIILFV